MEKTICDTCVNRLGCNTMDRRRGMACTDYKKEQSNERKIEKVYTGERSGS